MKTLTALKSIRAALTGLADVWVTALAGHLLSPGARVPMG